MATQHSILRMLLGSILLIVLASLTPAIQATLTVPTTASFGLQTYGTYISFSSQRTFSTIYKDDAYWYFNGYGFQAQQANVTISTFFEDNDLVFTASKSSGSSITKVYCNNEGEPLIVDGVSSWSYSDATQILTLTVDHSSDVVVTVEWSEGGHQDPPPVDEEGQYHWTLDGEEDTDGFGSEPPVVVTISLGVLLLAGVVVIALLTSGRSKRRR